MVRDFITAALAFPTVALTVLLFVVVVFWVLVITGVLELDGDELLSVPVAAGASAFTVVAWLIALAGTALLEGTAARLAIAAGALVVGWVVARAVGSWLRRVLAPAKTPTRADFVGQPCVIRTGTVTDGFGQAEVHAPDGSSAVIQVRSTGSDTFHAGQTALIFDYDRDAEVFLVMPYEGGL